MGLLKAKRQSQAFPFTSVKIWNDISPLFQSYTLCLSNTHFVNKSRKQCLRFMFCVLYLGLLFFCFFVCALRTDWTICMSKQRLLSRVACWLQPNWNKQLIVVRQPGQPYATCCFRGKMKRPWWSVSLCLSGASDFTFYKLEESWSGICQWIVSQ